MENLKALVTGATGFVGSNLLRALVSRGFETHVMIRKDSNPWRISEIVDQVEVHHCDLTDRGRVRQAILEARPDVVFHLATYGGSYSQKEKVLIMNTNFMGTMNLVDAAVESGFECFVNTGSSSEYGVKLLPMKETDVLEPVDDYGVSKSAATIYCQSIAKSNDLNILTLRLFSPYGYFEDPDRLIPYLIKSCVNHEPVVLYNPDAFRDFIFVEDVVNAYLCIAAAPFKSARGGVFNVGTGKQYSVRDVFDIVKKVTHCEKEAVVSSNPSRMRPGDKSVVWEADVTRIRETFGWNARVSLSEGIERTVVWLNKRSFR